MLSATTVCSSAPPSPPFVSSSSPSVILLFGFLPSLGRSLIFVGIGPPRSRVFGERVDRSIVPQHSFHL
ncbi:hypothetical protein L1887_29194 [Cichorium endivia]|nr:hypothetical protein L1887_29194 [Cichorium endivia]